MRLPGTRYQEHGWEQVRKLLGQCSLQAFAQGELAALQDDARAGELLGHYVDTVAALVRANARRARYEAAGNSYGESVAELAIGLVMELQAHPADWTAFAAAVMAECRRSGSFWQDPTGSAVLRKKVNDMFATLRDKVDADHYQAACGRSCSPNKMYTYRMLDTAYGEVARLFAAWQENREQVSAILGRACEATPIEVRQMKTAAYCKGDWIIRWSEAQERFAGKPGPLHTRSKRFASLKNSPDKIEAMLGEIGAYEELSSNRDNDWQADAVEAADWLDDYWRVVAESEQAEAHGVSMPDQLLEAPVPDDEDGIDHEASDSSTADEADDPELQAIAASLSLPPRYLQMAGSAEDKSSVMARAMGETSLPVRLAVYLKMLGSFDDCYPDDWLDPVTGELPTMQQLAALDQVSLPTLRKRRDQAISMLQCAATGPKGE